MIASAEHTLLSAAFAIKDVAARQLATEESAKRVLSLIHASNVEFEKKQRSLSRELVRKHGSSVLIMVCGVLRGRRKAEHVLHVDLALMSRASSEDAAIQVSCDTEEIALSRSSDGKLDLDLEHVRTVNDYLVDTRLVARRVLLADNGLSPDSGDLDSDSDSDSDSDLFAHQRGHFGYE